MHSNGKATKTGSLFRMEVSVGIIIKATPERIWRLITTAGNFTNWNSTIKSIEGSIALGETISLRTTAVPDRVFKLKVTRFEPPSMMLWQDGAAPMFKGERRYSLSAQADGSTDFVMAETFSGLMLPLIAGSLPDFRPTFEQYAADLKAEAERAV